MTFSILHTSARPEKWREVYDAWIAAADHPEDVEYVLVVDERWGFKWADAEGLYPADGVGMGTVGPLKAWYDERDVMMVDGEQELSCGNLLLWNTRRKCYVDGVNLAAKHATGDILIVNADDQYPCPHWDTVLSQSILAQTIDPAHARCVVWAPTGTPDEFNRRMMPMPILSRRRYLDLGYVFYPAYESMYADNDFCEQALHDQEQSLFCHVGFRCSVVRLDQTCIFPHRHAFFTPGVPMDAAYKAQNRQEAYNTGAAILAQRRQNGFTDVDMSSISTSASTTPIAASTLPRRKLAICISGERFSLAWISRLLEMTQLTRFHDLRFVLAYSSNVYHTRIQLATEALSLKPDVDYIMWVDDDNLVSVQQILQAILDLETVSSAGMVAGWTLTGSDTAPDSSEEISCGRLVHPSCARTALSVRGLMDGVEDLKEVDYTGFPFVIMRRGMLDAVGPDGFAPYSIPYADGVVGEDISFCIRAREKGYRVLVDRRILVPHLKLRDITQRLLKPVTVAVGNGNTPVPGQNGLPRVGVDSSLTPAAV